MCGLSGVATWGERVYLAYRSIVRPSRNAALLVCFFLHAQLLYKTQDHLPVDGPAHCRLGFPTYMPTGSPSHVCQVNWADNQETWCNLFQIWGSESQGAPWSNEKPEGAASEGFRRYWGVLLLKETGNSNKRRSSQVYCFTSLQRAWFCAFRVAPHWCGLVLEITMCRMRLILAKYTK